MQKKNLLGEERIPRRGTTSRPTFPSPCRHPCIRAPGSPRSRRSGAAVPDGADRPGSLDGALDRHPRGDPRDVQNLAADAAGARHPPRAGVGLQDDLRIYFKYESVSPSGSHKSTPPCPGLLQQASRRHAADDRDRRRPVGQRLSMACQVFGLELTVYMVKVSYHQKPYRRLLMELKGAKVHPSPDRATPRPAARRSTPIPTTRQPGARDLRGRRGRVGHPGSKYALGSVLNHVLLHQTVIGVEAIGRLERPTKIPTSSSAASAAAAALPASPPVHAGETRRNAKIRFVGGRAHRLPVADQGRVRLRFRRRRRRSRRCSRCTRSVTTSCRPASTPAACATTPWRRSSAMPTSSA